MLPINLYDLKAIGNHLMHASRERGESAAAPLAFIGLVTVAIGVCMIMKAQQQAGRHR